MAEEAISYQNRNNIIDQNIFGRTLLGQFILAIDFVGKYLQRISYLCYLLS